MVTKVEEGEGESQFVERPTAQYDFVGEGNSSSLTLVPEREEKSTFERLLITHIDYYDEAGSLLIAFNSRSERILKSDAFVLLGLSNEGLASVEILLDDKEVAEELSKALRPYRYR